MPVARRSANAVRVQLTTSEYRWQSAMYIRRAIPDDRGRLLDVWLRAVQATHTFVSEADIQSFLPLVRDYLASDESEFWVLCAASAGAIGFMGLRGHKMESLFLDPEFHGRGGGRQLVRHAQELRGELTTDVNEQNLAARRFYEACGFVVEGRSELDETGRPYPLLHLRFAPPDTQPLARPKLDPREGRRIFHITSTDEVNKARRLGEYRSGEFDREQFIHCSYSSQVLAVANRLFHGRADLVLLEIDRGRLPCRVIDENLQGGTDLFPHVYGAIPISAIARIHPFPCQEDGSFKDSSGILAADLKA